MKRIISICLLLVILVTVSVVSVGAVDTVISPTKGEYVIVVDTNDPQAGTAEADKYSVKIGTDETVTLTAIEGDGTFQEWTIDGDYKLVTGDLDSKVVVIRPNSDVHATAIFKTSGQSTTSSSASGTNSGSTSPKTGNISYALILMLIAVVAGVVAVIVSKKVKRN